MWGEQRLGRAATLNIRVGSERKEISSESFSEDLPIRSLSSITSAIHQQI